MKNIFYFLAACVFVLAGCNKKTDLNFDKPVDERVASALSGYQTALTTAPGWKLFVYPKGAAATHGLQPVGGLSYYLQFSTTGRVLMVSDFLTSIAATPKESGYTLKALQRPSLVFDTYTYMHIPADPDPNISFSPTGTGGDGWGTDFNFSFTEVAVKDTMYLEGNFNKSTAVLVKATQAEMDAAFKNSRLQNIMNFSYGYAGTIPFLYFMANASLKVGVGFDFNYGFVSFTYADGATVVNSKIPSSFTTYGIHLGQAVKTGDYTFQDLYWDDATSKYYILSGTTKIFFISSATPAVSLSLTNIIGGSQFTTIGVPPGAGLYGQGSLFTTKYNAAKAGMLASAYGLTMDEMDFVFTASAKTMDVNVLAYQGAVGPFLLTYSYTYTVDANGLFKFTKIGQNGNAALVVSSMNNILSYIENDQFILTAVSSSSSFLGTMTSNQNPTFSFSGYLF